MLLELAGVKHKDGDHRRAVSKSLLPVNQDAQTTGACQTQRPLRGMSRQTRLSERLVVVQAEVARREPDERSTGAARCRHAGGVAAV